MSTVLAPTAVTVDVAEFAARFGEVVALVAAGAPVVVASGDTRVAVTAAPALEPAPAADPPRREWKFGLHAGAMVMRDDFNDPIDEEQFFRGEI